MSIGTMPLVHWYKRDPHAAIEGMLGLTMEERGAYNTLIDMLYARDGNVPNNDRLMAVAQQCDIRKWRRVRDQLIAKGKVRVALDGRLTANRVESTLTEARSFAEVQANRARSRWEVGEKSGRSPGEKTENSIENSAANHAKMAMPPGNASTSTSTTTLESSLPSKGSNSAQSVVHNPDANGQVHVRIDSPHWKACSERYRKERGKDPPRDYAFGWHFPAEWIKKAGGTTK